VKDSILLEALFEALVPKAAFTAVDRQLDLFTPTHLAAVLSLDPPRRHFKLLIRFGDLDDG
jgi:hypothetical protein